MALSLKDKLKNLGYYFIADSKGTVFGIQGGFVADIQRGGQKGMTNLPGVTLEEIKEQGLSDLVQKVNKPLETTDDWNSIGIDAQTGFSLPGDFRSSTNSILGDVRNIKDLDKLSDIKLKEFEGAYNKAEDVVSWGKGGYYTKEQLGKIIGKITKDVPLTPYKTMPLATEAYYKSIGKENPYGEVNPNNPEEWIPKSVVDKRNAEQKKYDEELKAKMQGEQATEKARLAEVKKYEDANQPVPRSLIQGTIGEVPASGKPATSLEQKPDGTFNLVNEVTGQVIQEGIKDVVTAQAIQNQTTTGGTPQLSGRPDLFAVEPTQAEKDAGIQPIVPQAGMAPVQPTVATPEQIKQIQAGTLPTPAAEKAGGTVDPSQKKEVPKSDVDVDGLTDEQIKAAEDLADAVAGDDELLYNPKISPEDIDSYISSGKLDAAKELKPYYDETIGRAKEAYLQSVLYETQAQELTMRQQALTRAKELKSIQDDFERRGVTYSGEASQELGVQSALSPELNSTIKGLFQERQDILSTSTKQNFEKNIASLTQAAEQQLGTQAVKDITGADTSSLASGLFKTLGTPTFGDIAREQTTNIAKRSQEIAKAKVAKELAMSKDFPTSEYLKYI